MTDDGTTPVGPESDQVDSPTPAQVVDAKPAGIYISPKSLLIGAAVLLLIVLIALIIFLLLRMRGNPAAHTSDEKSAGLAAELVINGPGRGDKPTFSRPMGVAWSAGGDQVYVADSDNNRICVFDDTGRFLRDFGTFGIAKPLEGAKATWDPGELNYPTDVAIDDDGQVYVADFYNDSISVFEEDGTFVRRFPDPDKKVGLGGSGANGLGIAVTAIAVAGDEVYATDSYQVVVFSREGKFLRQFGRPGTGVGGFDRPNGIAVGGDGTVYVSDSNNNRVVALKPDGTQRWVVGERIAADAGATPQDALVLPRGVALMGDGSLIVADPLAQRLTPITAAGKLGVSLGERGTNPAQLNFPNDVDWAGNRLLVADRANNRVQILRIVEE